MDKELLNKVIDICLVNDIKESELYLKLLDNRIKIYRNHIEYLEDTKPLFFQKKKLEQHNRKIECYENKIFDAYQKMSKEIDYIMELKGSIGKD